MSDRGKGASDDENTLHGPTGSIEIGGEVWRIADPFETQDEGFAAVPSAPGLYLWLRRDPPGPPTVSGLTTEVLYVGETKDLRKRLHRYSAVRYVREDPVLHALFDRVIAPQLNTDDLRHIVTSRLAPGLGQMWIRDHVVFCWAVWDGLGRRQREADLRATLEPLFNRDRRWTRYEQTWHELHDLTLPIAPYDPFSGPA